MLVLDLGPIMYCPCVELGKGTKTNEYGSSFSLGTLIMGLAWCKLANLGPVWCQTHEIIGLTWFQGQRDRVFLFVRPEVLGLRYDRPISHFF